MATATQSAQMRELDMRQRSPTAHPFSFRVTSEGREFLLQKGTDQGYGARHMKRAIERYVVSPLARLLATKQVGSGDVLIVDRHPGEKGLAFLRDTDRRSSYAPMSFLAPQSMRLASAEI